MSTATSRRSIADQLQTCRRLVGNYNLYPNMDIKWLHKSHRSPISCKKISGESVANRSRSRCKQGLRCLFPFSGPNNHSVIIQLTSPFNCLVYNTKLEKCRLWLPSCNNNSKATPNFKVTWLQYFTCYAKNLLF